MASTSNKYIYGSVAENIKDDIKEDIYDPYKENAVLKSKKTARNNAKIKSKIIFNIMIIFGLFAIIMFRYAQISQLNFDSNELSKQYVAMINDNARISIEIEKAMDLNGIREVAENNLNMHKPDKSQIVYVNIPKQDLTILACKEQSKVLIMLKDVESSIKKFLNVLG